MSDSFAFLSQPASVVAPLLLGSILERQVDGKTLRVRIVETEAYDQFDSASHSYKPETPRTAVIFGSPGKLYVYFTYGMHYCANVVVGQSGVGAAVLIRAVEPLKGEGYMADKRGVAPGINISNGPAKLCQALSINLELNGHDLRKSPIKLLPQPALNSKDITTTTRIGISKNKDLLLRFYETNSLYVSKA